MSPEEASIMVCLESSESSLSSGNTLNGWQIWEMEKSVTCNVRIVRTRCVVIESERRR